jgi:hypothetical protein
MSRTEIGGRRRGALRFFLASLLALPLAFGNASKAVAGPPFLTDDPQPIDYKHYELYLFTTMDKSPDGKVVNVPAIEYNIGAMPNVHVHFVLPYTFSSPTGMPTVSGLGDAEFGVKLRFVQEVKGTPQIGIFPMVELPTGNATNGLGNGRAWFRLPIWAQKSEGPWTTYGGGGYAINTAPGMKNYPFAGWLIQRDIGSYLTLGGELFSQGPSSVGGLHSTYYNLGGYIKPSDRFNILFSLGHTISGTSHAVGYLALYWTGGPAEKKEEPSPDKPPAKP